MNAILVTAPNVHELAERDIPEPKPGQYLIKIEAAVINPSDTLMMSGNYLGNTVLPKIPGFEGCGTVVSAGPGVPTSLLGKRVGCLPDGSVSGTYSEYVTSWAPTCIEMPKDLDFEEGAGFFVNPMTVLLLVDRLVELNCKAVIINAASSYCGKMLIKLCAKKEITVISTVRREETAEIIRNELKQEHVVNTGKEGYKAELKAICDSVKPTVCIDSIGGDTTGEMLSYMGFGSTLIALGLLSGKPYGNISPLHFIGSC